MCNHLVFRHYPITCHFRKIKTLGSTELAGIIGGERFGSVTVNIRFKIKTDIFQFLLFRSIFEIIEIYPFALIFIRFSMSV